jgi:uncharacterized OB-fold protein
VAVARPTLDDREHHRDVSAPAADPAPAPAPLVEGLFGVGRDGRPHLVASRCAGCAELAFPRRSVCPRCKRPTMAPVAVGERGRLYSVTACHAAPAGWRAPYLQAYVEIPEGLRIFSLISDEVAPEADALAPGAPMELVVEPVGAAGDRVTYKYRPAAEA